MDSIMKLRFMALSFVLALSSVSGVRAEDAKPVPTPEAPLAKSERPETELEKTMTKMGKSWRQVRKAARDGQLSPDTAAIVAGVRTNAEAALKLKPALEAEQPVMLQAKFQSDYQAQMKKLIAALSSLEAALRANDVAGATKLVGEVGDLMKAGHKEFKKPEEKRS